METRTLVFVIMAALVALVAGDCSKSSSAPCKFTCGDNVLDLSPLAKTDNTPLIQDKISSDGSNKYSFSPCSTFTEGNCTSVAVCQLDPLGQGPSFPVGTLDSLAISADGSTLTYSDSYQGMTRKAVVTLKCDATAVNASLDIAAPSQAESSVTTYPMTLTSRYACMSSTGASSTAPATSPAAPVSSDRPTTAPPTTAGSNVTTVPPAPTTTPPKRNDTTTQPPSSNSTDVTTAPPSSNTTSGVTTMPPQTTVVNNRTTPAKSNTTGVVTTVPVPVSGKTTTPKSRATTTPYKTTTALASVTKSAGWLVTMLLVAARLTV